MATSPNVTPDPRNTTIASGKRAVEITATQVQPPSPLYLQVEDSIILNILVPTFATPFTVSLNLRWLRPDGEIISVRRPLLCNATGNVLQLTLGEGFLLSATVNSMTNAVTEPGVAFCSLTINRDIPDGLFVNWNLFTDYISAVHSPTWPYGRTTFPQEGPGHIRSIVGTTPAAGADISEAVPAGVRWRLIAFRATLTTSANVANRVPVLTLDDSSNIFAKSATFGQVQTASLTQSWEFFDGALSGTFVSDWVAPLPTNIFLSAGYRIRTVTNLLQVNDQWTPPTYLIQEWVNQ